MTKTQLIVDNLEVLRKKEQHDGNGFKARAYAKAIAAIKAMPRPIAVVEDVEGVPGVGKKIKEKIGEILSTGHLAAADAARADSAVGGVDELMGVYGIGKVKARALVAAGIRGVADLRRAFAADAGLLNAKQEVGLLYYEDLLKRIPRAEVVAHEAEIQAAFRRACPACQVDIVGSFRRGAATSGDVDALVSLPAGTKAAAAQRAFSAAIADLKDSGYMVETLAEGPKKFMGIARLPRSAAAGPSTARRIDLLLTPAAEVPFALLYFTGSDTFNVAMRKRALERGVSLNEHGFTPAPSRAFATEKDIFDFLDMTYVAPTGRQ